MGSATTELGSAFSRNLRAVKDAVKTIDEADWLCGPAGNRSIRGVGDKWVALCPLPDHEEKTPSFTVFPDDHWWCFGCSRGGDVLDLHRLAHGFAEPWEALVSLATERNVELPGRTERWHGADARKAEYRRLAFEVLGDVLCRRLFKVLVLPALDATPDDAERDAAVSEAWAGWQRGHHRGFWARMAEGVVRGDEDYLRAVAAARASLDARNGVEGGGDEGCLVSSSRSRSSSNGDTNG